MSKLIDLYWLGGSPCAGKSSVGALLRSQFGLDLYEVDHALRGQMDRLDPIRQPALSAWFAASCDERWLKPVDELLSDAIACYTDHFGLIVEDLNRQPPGQITLVEGTALLPHLVAGQGVRPDRALWMTPTPSFQMEHYSRRPWVKEMLAECSDPERAFANWMERDIRFAEWVANEATRYGYSILSVDGSEAINENTIRVADHFGLAYGSPQLGRAQASGRGLSFGSTCSTMKSDSATCHGRTLTSSKPIEKQPCQQAIDQPTHTLEER